MQEAEYCGYTMYNGLKKKCLYTRVPSIVLELRRILNEGISIFVRKTEFRFGNTVLKYLFEFSLTYYFP